MTCRQEPPFQVVGTCESYCSVAGVSGVEGVIEDQSFHDCDCSPAVGVPTCILDIFISFTENIHTYLQR